MKIWSAILTGIGELLGHKLRSLLTMLGVIFGIGSVIAMVSIGAGARQEALEQIKLMGINVIQINRRSVTSDMARQAEKDSPNGVTYGDAQAIQKLYPAAQLVVPVCQVEGDVRIGGRAIPAKVLGTSADYAEASRVEVGEGRFLDAGDLATRAPVCVIGMDVKRQAFAFEDPVGKLINVGGRDFRVIGVLAERAIQSGRSRFALRDVNQDVYIPVTIALDDFQIYVEQAVPSDVGSFRHLLDRMMRRPPLEGRSVTQVIVQVADEQQTWEAAHVARRILDRRHKNVPDYDIVIPAELLRQSQQTQRIFNIVMGAIASISLLVGGIGIMNIMLATVTQRQREIGIRRCIGASRADIIRQFLIECLVITIVGGLIGVAIGVEMARLISTYAKWPTVVSGQAILLSLAVASITGVVFGLYPATRAASIQPVEALRSG